ncbi:GntR family transcriptional regulator [Comamonas sp. lk]|uniref:GntR family transcriptional regulator n=1 Tax=Comamonas sp. lk TaxID=2201272 RepID=UPI000EACA8DC|nr:GntR family transcriptional regulator [Comamonas sp. lk]
MPTGVHANERRPSGDGASAIAATLEEDIVLGLLAPKVRLVEDELMERFEAKRHVVREALNQLESAGLVERKRNIGALVKAFSKAEVVHLYEMRELLEAESMRKIPLPLNKDALQQLHRIQAGHDAAIQNQEPRNIFRTNQEFHRLLFAQCGNAFLSQSIEDFARKTHAIRFGALMSRERQLQSQKEHHELLAVLAEGDRERLINLTIAHLVPPRDHYLKAQEMLFA